MSVFFDVIAALLAYIYALWKTITVCSFRLHAHNWPHRYPLGSRLIHCTCPSVNRTRYSNLL